MDPRPECGGGDGFASAAPIHDGAHGAYLLSKLMKRLEYLAIAATTSGELWGCLDARVEVDRSTPTGERVTPEPIARSGVPQDICAEDVGDIVIIEIVDPAFGVNWDPVEVSGQYGELTEDSVVVGLEGHGAARTYPLGIL